MMTERELNNIYNQKIAKPERSTDVLDNVKMKAAMRFVHGGLLEQMDHIPPDSELGMEMQHKLSFYQQSLRKWWKGKCDLLRAKEQKERPKNPDSMKYIHQ
jgi:hypothetical protein